MKRIAILISGRGSNMEAIVRACATEGWNARVAAVVSNRADAPGLEFARQHGIATAVVDHTAFDSREAFDAELAKVLDGFAPDVVALAGFMRILTDAFVTHFERRLINVHPSLLPAFTGLHTRVEELAHHHGLRLAELERLMETPSTAMDLARGLFPKPVDCAELFRVLDAHKPAAP